MPKKGKYKFLKETELQVCQDYKEGLSEAKLSKKYLTSYGHIRKILDRYNITRRTISESNGGENNGMFGRKAWNKGKTKETDSRIAQQAIKISKENNPSYKHGRYIGNKKRREACRKRYNYRCQRCLKHQSYFGRALDVHHIDYNPENNNQNNLIPLCIKHHCQTKGNRKYWIAWYNLIVEE